MIYSEPLHCRTQQMIEESSRCFASKISTWRCRVFWKLCPDWIMERRHFEHAEVWKMKLNREVKQKCKRKMMKFALEALRIW